MGAHVIKGDTADKTKQQIAEKTNGIVHIIPTCYWVNNHYDTVFEITHPTVSAVVLDNYHL
jgi:hypothetical protein